MGVALGQLERRNAAGPAAAKLGTPLGDVQVTRCPTCDLEHAGGCLKALARRVLIATWENREFRAALESVRAEKAKAGRLAVGAVERRPLNGSPFRRRWTPPPEACRVWRE